MRHPSPFTRLFHTPGEMRRLRNRSLSMVMFSKPLGISPPSYERLRGRTRKRYLWVDAICINQTDIPGRKNQVMKTKTIYEKSIQVLVWLGEEAEGSGA